MSGLQLPVLQLQGLQSGCLAFDEEGKIILNLDGEGDLVLVIGGEGAEKSEQIRIRVCSRSLARATKVFQIMLFGGYAKSKPIDGQWKVRFPEDRVQGMVVLMAIIHGHTKLIKQALWARSHHRPGFPNCVTLCDIAMMADKYNLVPILKPWAEAWVRETWCLLNGWSAESLWVAWVFGCESWLQHLLDEVLLSLYVDRDYLPGHDSLEDDEPGALRIKNFGGLEMPLYSPEDENQLILGLIGAEEQLELRRPELLGAMLAPVQSFLSDLETWRTKPLCQGPQLDLRFVSATFSDGLQQAELLPLPTPDDYDGSVRSLYTSLMKAFEFFQKESQRWHARCDACIPIGATIKQVKDAYYKRPFIQLTETQRKRIEAHRQEIGIGLGDYSRPDEEAEAKRESWYRAKAEASS